MRPGAQTPDASRGPVTVLCAVLGPAEAGAVGVLASSPDAVDLTRRCADIAELLAASAAGLGRVAVVSADLPGLDRPVVAALHSEGTRVVALCADVPWQHDRVRALGVDAIADDAAIASQLVDRVRSVAALGAPSLTDPATFGGPGGEDGPTPDAGGWRAEVAAQPWGGPATDGHGTTTPVRSPGAVVAVWGPTGAPGRSTIALNLADALVDGGAARRRGRRGRGRAPGRTPVGWSAEQPARSGGGPTGGAPTDDTCLLVDADTYSGALAQMAGLLDESSGIAAACRAAGNGTLTVHQLAQMAPVLSPRLRILTGIARASRWPELPAASLEVVWQECRSLARWTVIDCGFAVESDEMLTYDTRAPQRNAATLSALSAADVVVVVGGADAVSVQRLVRGLDDLRSSGIATAEPIVVINRVRASAVGRHPGTALRAALARYANIADAHLVPDDQASCDAALLAGRSLGEVAPASPVRRAVAELAEAVRRRVPDPASGGLDRRGSSQGGELAAATGSPTVAH